MMLGQAVQGKAPGGDPMAAERGCSGPVLGSRFRSAVAVPPALLAVGPPTAGLGFSVLPALVGGGMGSSAQHDALTRLSEWRGRARLFPGEAALGHSGGTQVCARPAGSAVMAPASAAQPIAWTGTAVLGRRAAAGLALGCGAAVLCRSGMRSPTRASPSSSTSTAGPTRASSVGSQQGIPSAATNFVAGLVSGIAVDVPLHPLDTLKTRLQAPGDFAASPRFRHLYRGLSPVLLRSLPCSSIFFVTYDSVGQLIERQVPAARGTMWRDAAAGSIANTAACSFRVPCEVLKQRMQYHDATLRATARSLYRGGLASCYMGFGATVARELAFAAVQMPLFEHLKQRSPLWSEERSGARRGLVGAFSGGLSGAVAGAVTTPLDVVKTRAMLALTVGQRAGILQTLVAVHAEGGVKALFRGVLPRTAYVGVSCAMSFGAFEWARSLLMQL